MRQRYFLKLIAMLGSCGVLMAQAAEPDVLTLEAARETAMRKHPRITGAELRALAAKEGVREARSALLPNFSLNAGAAGALDQNTRIAGTSLTVSSVFDRLAMGASLTQLVTDFGRSRNLTESSLLKAQAEEKTTEVTRAQLLLQVDAAYYDSLKAQAVLRVAEETVRSRLVIRDHAVLMASNLLKSELDTSFAEVNLQEARLLVTRARNEINSSFAVLAALLDVPNTTDFRLADRPTFEAIPKRAEEYIVEALGHRPELARARLEKASAEKLAQAERRAMFPTVSVQSTAGVIPYREAGLNHDYVAAGIVLNWPLFNGGHHEARQKGAELRASANEAALHEEQNSIVRDVRIAWLNATNAWERMDLTAKLAEQTRKSHALAEARYKAGIGSMVELSQAQFNLATSEIARETARYEYLLRRSILAYQTGELR